MLFCLCIIVYIIYKHYDYSKHFFGKIHVVTYLLSPWNRVLLENLSGFLLVKKFPAFYGTRKFITAFTRACHLSLSQSISPDPRPTVSIFRNDAFLRWSIVRTSPNPQAGEPPLVSCSWLQYIRSYSPYWRSLLQLQPEDTPCHGDRNPLNMENTCCVCFKSENSNSLLNQCG